MESECDQIKLQLPHFPLPPKTAKQRTKKEAYHKQMSLSPL